MKTSTWLITFGASGLLLYWWIKKSLLTWDTGLGLSSGLSIKSGTGSKFTKSSGILDRSHGSISERDNVLVDQQSSSTSQYLAESSQNSMDQSSNGQTANTSVDKTNVEGDMEEDLIRALLPVIPEVDGLFNSQFIDVTIPSAVYISDFWPTTEIILEDRYKFNSLFLLWCFLRNNKTKLSHKFFTVHIEDGSRDAITFYALVAATILSSGCDFSSYDDPLDIMPAGIHKTYVKTTDGHFILLENCVLEVLSIVGFAIPEELLNATILSQIEPLDIIWVKD